MKRSTMMTGAAAVLLAGCATSGTRIAAPQLEQFQPGVTTEAEVERALGRPQVSTQAADGTRSIGYVYVHAQAKASTFVPIVGVFTGGATGESQVVRFRFDQAGRLAAAPERADTQSSISTGLTGGRP